MFSDPLTLADASATNKTFYTIGFGPSSTIRSETARTPDKPRTLQISHEKTKGSNGSPSVARHLVKASSTDKDADGVYHTCTAHVVITTPADFDGETSIQDLVAFLKNFLSSGNVSSLLDGQP